MNATVISKAAHFEQVCRENSSYSTLETTVHNGFPIVLFYRMGKAEPDVGYMNAYVDDWFITLRSGMPCEWLKLTKSEEAALLEEIPNGDG